MHAHLRLGLTGLLAVLASVVFGRIIGFVAGGHGNFVMYASLALETGFLLATVYALVKLTE